MPAPTLAPAASAPSPALIAEDAKVTGAIESINGSVWVIGGKTFKVDQGTVLDRGLAVGKPARVRYRLLPDGTKVATEIGTAASSSAPTPDSVKLQLVADGLVSPVGLVPSPDGSGRLFVVDQVGLIWILAPGATRLGEPFLDLRPRMVTLNPGFDERGLLGLAFHPSFSTNGRFFVYYSAPLRTNGPPGWNHTSHISEFKAMAGDPNKADPLSERIVLQVDEPQVNHNAGQIIFGPDGFLYIPLGDGGGANDVGLGHPPIGNGQDTSTLLGSILRIDVDGGEPYGIPADNPFVGKEGRAEIYAFGLRNPFRIAFDSGGAHELFAADVGQNLREEVDIITKGGNYGWNIKEATLCFDPTSPSRPRPACPEVDAAGRPLIGPIIEYGNIKVGGIGQAVIGGFVYRGTALPAFNGAYIFGDFSASANAPDGRLFVATRPPTPGQMWPMKELRVVTNVSGRLDTFLKSFGQDASGEIYVLTSDIGGPTGNTGMVLKIVP
ncbi:MAG: PQQ-dependent sugar dehydrogenase [Chloroflexi bacterium]|nr:PQQ-dependent sugar dehydrogenase [Chloroflexota bacterium]MBI4288062.1 PQQ-dependent sugar dehydrogenase [Chloroflexota bacterium]